MLNISPQTSSIFLNQIFQESVSWINNSYLQTVHSRQNGTAFQFRVEIYPRLQSFRFLGTVIGLENSRKLSTYWMETKIKRDNNALSRIQERLNVSLWRFHQFLVLFSFVLSVCFNHSSFLLLRHSIKMHAKFDVHV